MRVRALRGDHQNHPQEHQNHLQDHQNHPNKQPPLGLLICMVLMVLEVILVFLGVVLVVPPQSTDPSSTHPPTGL